MCFIPLSIGKAEGLLGGRSNTVGKGKSEVSKKMGSISFETLLYC